MPDLNKDIEMNLTLNIDGAEKKVKTLKNDVEKDKLQFKADIDISGLVKQFEGIEKKISRISDSFSDKIKKNITSFSGNFKFDSFEKSLVDILDAISKIQTELLQIDFSKLNLSGIDNLNETLKTVGENLDKISNKLNLNPSKSTATLQRDLDNTNKQIENLKANSEEYNKLLKSLTGAKTVKLFQNIKDDENIGYLDALYEKIKRFQNLGGDISNATFSWREYDGSIEKTVTRTQSLLDLLREIKYNYGNMNDIKQSEPFVLKADDLINASRSVKTLEQLENRANRINDELKHIDDNKVEIHIAADDIERLTAAFDELKQSIKDVYSLLQTFDVRRIGGDATPIQRVTDEMDELQEKSRKVGQVGEEAGNEVVHHNGVSAFLNPDVDKNEWIWITERVAEYLGYLKEIATVKRNVQGDKVSYDITGSNGSKITVAQNSEGQWVKSSQVIADNTEKLKENARAAREAAKAAKESAEWDAQRGDREAYIRGMNQVAEDAEREAEYKRLSSQYQKEGVKQAQEAAREAREYVQWWEQALKDQELAKKQSNNVANVSAKDETNLQIKKNQLEALRKEIFSIENEEGNLIPLTEELGQAFLSLNANLYQAGQDSNVSGALKYYEQEYKNVIAAVREYKKELAKDNNVVPSSHNDLLKRQREEYEAINKAMLELSKTTAGTEQSRLARETLESHKEEYDILNNEILKLGDEVNYEEQSAKLAKIRLEYEEKIAKVRASFKDETTGKLDNWSKYLDSLAGKDQYSGQMAADINMAAYSIERLKNEIVEGNVPLDIMRQEMESLGERMSNITGLSSQVDDAISKLESRLNKLHGKGIFDYDGDINSLIEKLRQVGDQAGLDKVNAEIEEFVAGIKTVNNALGKSDLSDWAEKLQKNIIKNVKTMPQLKEVAEETLERINKLKEVDIDFNTKKAQDDLKELEKIVQQILDDSKLDPNKNVGEAVLAKFNQKVAKTISGNSAMARELKHELEGLKFDIHADVSIEQLKKAETHLNTIISKLHETGQTGASFFNTLRQRAMGVNAQLIAQYLSWQDMIRYARQAFNTIYELDTALVDLKKTSTMTNDELEAFYMDSSKIAQQTGVTTQEIISQAAAWSRLGYSSKEAATEMAALSSQFAQISPGMSVDTATDGLVSTMKAFHVEVDDVERDIMDNINRIGNVMATSNEEIVNMLTRSSAAMAAANNTIEETIALESAAVQITRNAETTGTAFRTISMRIRGYDEETEEYIGNVEELTGKIADLTKTADKPGGISLFTDETKQTYKSTYQILKDIAEIYHDLTDKQQAELLETLAGKRGGQVLAGILEDFSEVERAMQQMQTAAGSADDEMKIIEESWQFKLNNLKQTWVEILQGMIDRGEISQIIDALTRISEAIGKIIETAGPVPTIIAGLGLRTLILHFDKLSTILDKISKVPVFSKLFGKAKDIVDGAEGLEKVGKGLKEVEKVSESTAKATGKTAEVIGDVVEASGDMMSAMSKVSGETVEAMGDMAEATGDVVVAAGKASTEVGGLSGVIGKLATSLGVSTGAVIAFGAALAAIVAGAIIWDATTTTVKETEKEIENTTARMQELNAEIEQLNNLDTLTAAQRERLTYLEKELDLQKEILEVEKQKNLEEKYESGFADFFDPNNAYRQYVVDETNRGYYDTASMGYANKHYSLTEMNLYEATEELREYRDLLDDTTLSTEELEKVSEKNAIVEKNARSLRGEALKEILDYQEKMNAAKEVLSSGYFKEGDQAYDNAVEMIEHYSEWIRADEAAVRELEKLLPEIDPGKRYASTIEGILKKVEFQDLTNELIQLAKDGGATADVLTQKYAPLTEELYDAGIEAQDLANYLNHLADPDMDLRRQTANELVNSIKFETPEMAQNAIQELQDYFKANPEALTIAGEIDFDISNWTFDDLKKYLEKEASKVEIEPEFKFDISKHKKGLELINQALSSTGSLTEEMVDGITDYFSELDSFDASELFMQTANGIQLNTEELNRLNAEMKSFSYDQLIQEQQNVAKEYDNIVEAMSHMNKASDEYAQKRGELDKLRETARLLEETALDYLALTSAYQEFVDALSTPDQSAEYVNVANKYEQMEKLAQAGRFGNDDLRAYLNLFSYEDTTGASIETQIELFKELKKTIEGTTVSKLDFFTIDDQGNVTRKGLENFVQAVHDVFGDAYASLDENGDWAVDLTGKKLDEVLKKFNMSASGIELLFKAAQEFGVQVAHDTNLANEGIQRLGISAEEAQDKLKKMDFSGFDFKINEASIGQLNGAIESLKIFMNNNRLDSGEFNMDIDGMKEAYTLLDELIRRRQELQSKNMDVMTVDTSEMEEGLRKTIEIIQQLEINLQNLEQAEVLEAPEETVESYKQKILDSLSSLKDAELSEYVQKLDLSDILDIDEQSLDKSIQNIQNKLSSITKDELLDNTVTIEVTAKTESIVEDTKQAVEEASQEKVVIETEIVRNYYDTFISEVETTKPELEIIPRIDKDKIVSAVPKSIKVDIVPEVKRGSSNVRIGAAGAYGGAFAGGKALVGELGQELVVDPHNGTYQTVGDHGAEFINLPKDAIVFNHWQTKQLFRTGGTGRGTAFAEGNAYAGEEHAIINIGAKFSMPDVSKFNKQLDGIASSADKVTKATKNMGKGLKDAAKDVDKASDAMSDLSSQLDQIQSAWKTLDEIQQTYAETGMITVDQAQQLMDTDFRYLALLQTEGDQLGINTMQFENLTQAKLYEMQVTLARNATDIINNLTTEAQAAEYLSNAYIDLANNSLTAAEATMKAAQAAAHARGALQGQAADTVVAGYTNAAAMLQHVDFSGSLGRVSPTHEAVNSMQKPEEDEGVKEAIEEQTKASEHQYNWIERLLEKLNRTTEKWTSQAERFFTFWNKNWAINKAIQSNRLEIAAAEDAYSYYLAQAQATPLSKKYKSKVENGTIAFENITNDELAEKIDSYKQWIDYMREAEDTLQSLHDAEVEMIKQKLDTILEYYETITDYYDSAYSKFESLFSVKEASGQRTSITDLLKQYQAAQGLVDNLEEQLFVLQTGVSHEYGAHRTSEEVNVDLAAANTEADETDLYNRVIEKRDALLEKQNTFNELNAVYNDLYKQWKNEKNKKAKKQLEKELKEAKKERNKYALSKSEKSTLSNLNKIYQAYSNMFFPQGEDEYYQKAKEQADKLEDQQAQYENLLSQIQDLKQQRAEATSKKEKNALTKQIKALQKQAKKKKLTKKQQSTLNTLEKQMEVLEDVAGGTKYYANTIITRDKLYAKQEKYDELVAQIAQKRQEILEATTKKQKKQLQKELKALEKKAKKAALTKNEQKTLTAVEEQLAALQQMQEGTMVDSAVVANAKYQELLKKIGTLQGKASLKPAEQQKLALYMDELNAINAGVASENLSTYMSVYEKW